MNCWYQAHCAWNVYVKDGMVWREEQAADYPQTRPDVPDFNPRGCQKGACFSERMYDPRACKYPLKRVGERGSGKWQRISWDAGARRDRRLDDRHDHQGRHRSRDLGPRSGLSRSAPIGAASGRFAILLDSTALDMNTEIGDGHRGAAETFGKIVFERSADDYFFSDLILMLGREPDATRRSRTRTS